jgi:hypothetical protein
MRLSALALAAPLVLVACQYATAPVVLKHPKTGKIVQCGPYWIANDAKDMSGVARMERGCIEDYKEQGYVRQ